MLSETIKTEKILWFSTVWNKISWVFTTLQLFKFLRSPYQFLINFKSKVNLAVVSENRMGCYDTEWCMETEHFECDIVVAVSWVSIEPAEWSNKLLSLERFTERITVWCLYWIYIVVVRDTFFPDRSLFFKTMDPSLKKLAQKNHVNNYISSNQVTTLFNRFPTRRYQQRDV